MELSSISLPHNVQSQANIEQSKFQALYQESLENPNAFWGQVGKRLDWISPYTSVKNTRFDKNNVDIRWFED